MHQVDLNVSVLAGALVHREQRQIRQRRVSEAAAKVGATPEYKHI